MTDPIILNEKERQAVHAQRDAAQADILVRKVQIQEIAEKVTEKIPDQDQLAFIVRQQVENVLAHGTEQEKAMILARVPYICQDIKDIKGSLSNMEEKLTYVPLIQKIVFGGSSVILLGALTAVLAMIYR